MMNTYLKSFIVSLCLFVVLLNQGGCEKRTDIEHPTPQTSKAEITTADAVAFAKNLEDSLKRGEATFFIRSMDWSALVDHVLVRIPEKNGKPQYSRRDLLAAFSKDGGFARNVTDKIRNGGSYHFLKVRNFGNETEPRLACVFRLVDSEGGLDYHALYLHRAVDGEIRIDEIYLYHFGETFSESLRRNLVPELYVGGVSSYGTPMSKVVQIHFQENHAWIERMFSAYENRDYATVLTIYDQLPRELQDYKTFEILRLQAATQQPDPAVLSFVLADLRERMAGDVCADFISLDVCFRNRDFHEALACVERIDASVGRDVYLNFFRCLALSELGRKPEARELLKKTYESDPELKSDLSFRGLEKILR